MFSYEMLVNCENRLPEDFVPPSLAAPDIAFAADPSDEKRFLEVRAARHAKRLFDAAKAEGIFLYGISGYRSYERQEGLLQIFCRFISMRNCHAGMQRTSDRTGP
jgi:D-alanyl-D-alanine carboxypeptidase